MSITQERLKEVLNYDSTTGIFKWKISRGCIKSGKVAGTVMANGYLRIAIDGVNYLAHRLAWLYIHGVFPINFIDHRDHNKQNNRINNLRDVTRSQNAMNLIKSRCDSKTGKLGVKTHRQGKFISSIMINGCAKYLGLFNTAIAAHEAYLKAKRKYHKTCEI